MIIPITPELDEYVLHVARICAEQYGTTAFRVLAERWRPDSAKARALFVYVLHEATGYSLKTIASTLSMNHSGFTHLRKYITDEHVQHICEQLPPTPVCPTAVEYNPTKTKRKATARQFPHPGCPFCGHGDVRPCEDEPGRVWCVKCDRDWPTRRQEVAS